MLYPSSSNGKGKLSCSFQAIILLCVLVPLSSGVAPLDQTDRWMWTQPVTISRFVLLSRHEIAVHDMSEKDNVLRWLFSVHLGPVLLFDEDSTIKAVDLKAVARNQIFRVRKLLSFQAIFWGYGQRIQGGEHKLAGVNQNFRGSAPTVRNLKLDLGLTRVHDRLAGPHEEPRAFGIDNGLSRQGGSLGIQYSGLDALVSRFGIQSRKLGILVGSLRGVLGSPGEPTAVLERSDRCSHFHLYRPESLQRNASTDDADNCQENRTAQRHPIEFVFSLIDTYFWNSHDGHFAILPLLLGFGIVGACCIFVVVALKSGEQEPCNKASCNECRVFSWPKLYACYALRPKP